MAKSQAPLLSIDPSGTFGGLLTASKWKGRNYLRLRVNPSNPNTGLQQGMRASMRYMTQEYKNLSAAEKANWKIEGDKLSITALNAMVRISQVRVRQDKGIKRDPTYAEGAVEAAPTVPAVVNQPKSLKVTWVDSAGADDTCTFLHMSTTVGFTPGPANLLRVIDKGVQLYIVPNLTTGTIYYFKLRGSEEGGTLGTLTAEVNGTPT